ncbi:uncharacterized protein TNCV_798961 [Trichonephila clavipes]|nr:uncharacterized protein TNCV_798961 [Trichonephila clavipes]
MKFFVLALVILGALVELNDAAADGGTAAACQQIQCRAPCRVVRNPPNCPTCQCNAPNGICRIYCPNTCSLVNSDCTDCCPYECDC